MIRFLFILLSFSCLFAEDYTSIEDQAKLPILTPSFADRKISKIRLQNGLEAYLISDPQAFKSAAALVVQAGSWEDPEEYPGLAHFLEHMLFLGTEKYPIESDYDRFIKAHNGKSNAYTAGDHTLYAFSISNDAFEEALDRFAHFFQHPLFNPSGVDRELQAIDQEFAKNFNHDVIREFYVLKELGNTEHPFHRFSSGNSKTLSKVSQKLLRQWYQSHYSANRMKLIVYSPLSMDALKDLVAREFKGIPTSNTPQTPVTVPLTSESQQGKMIYIQPVKNIHSMRLLWELPREFAHMLDSKPTSLLCYVLGHESPGSLLAELKKENLAERIDCSTDYLGPNHLLFSLNISLTEEGLKHTHQVLEKIFQSIDMLKKEGIPEYIFDEVQKINILRYQYQLREDPFEYVMEMGGELNYEPIETFPEHSMILQKFDPQAIKEALTYLTPQQAVITVVAPFDLTGVSANRVEQWMGIPYTIQNIPKEILEELSHPKHNAELSIPLPNPFIPQKLNLVASDTTLDTLEKIPRPETIMDNPEAKIYYAKDNEFQVPHTIWYFEIKTPAIKEELPQTVVLADLYVKCLEEAFKGYSYDAKMADLDYNFDYKDGSLYLTLSGYNDNAETLFDIILQHLKTCQPTPQQFAIFKDSLMREYQNFTQESSLRQALEVFRSIIYKDYSTSQQKAKSLQSITYDDLMQFTTHLYDRTFTTGVLYGNIEKSQALRVADKLNRALGSQPYLQENQPQKEVIALSEAHGPYFVVMKGNFSGNATVLGIEYPSFSFKARAAQQILSQAMNSSFYATLRTKQQTGYIVQNDAEEVERHLFNLFAVQSNTHDPRDLLARFELFLEGFLQEMAKSEITEEQFETIRQSLMTTIEQRPHQSLTEMGDLIRTLAFRYRGDFDWIAKRLEGFKQLTYEEFLAISREFLGKNNKRRLAVLMEGALTQESSFKYIQLDSIKEIKEGSSYTSRDE